MIPRIEGEKKGSGLMGKREAETAKDAWIQDL
jgi:hypothetical protein